MHAFKSFKVFDEGLKELTKISSKIRELFEDKEYTEKTATQVLMDYFSEIIPTIADEDYPNTPAISITADEVGLKFAGQIAFGWRTKLDEKGEIRYDFRISINANNRVARNSLIMKEASKLGWRTVDKKRPNPRLAATDAHKQAAQFASKEFEEAYTKSLTSTSGQKLPDIGITLCNATE